jgi:methyl-accepting chemotaxis protein
MAEWGNTSIRKKLIIIQLSTAFMAVLLCLTFFVYNGVKVYKDSAVKNKYSIAEIVGINAIPALEFVDHEAANQMLLKLQSNPTVLNAIIFDKEGRPFAHYNKSGEYSFPFPSSMVDEEKTQQGFGQRFIVSYKIIGKEFLGTVKLRSDLGDFKEIVISYLKIAALILLASLIVAFIISSVLQRSITTRLLTLVHKTKQVADTDDYSIRVPSEGKDEIATLSMSFNNMLGQIEKMQSILKKNNVELERRVKASTV